VAARFDILPALKGEDSPKGSSRFRVSSARKFPFGRGLHGYPPDCDRGSGFQRVKPCQWGLPPRTRRVGRREYRLPRQRGIHPAWYCHSRPSDTGRGRVGSALLPDGASVRSTVAVKDRVPNQGRPSRLSTGGRFIKSPTLEVQNCYRRWVTPLFVEFIPGLKDGAFSSHCGKHRRLGGSTDRGRPGTPAGRGERHGRLTRDPEVERPLEPTAGSDREGPMGHAPSSDPRPTASRQWVPAARSTPRAVRRTRGRWRPPV